MPLIGMGSTLMDDQRRSIFVSIAAYRDAECGPTIRDMLAKADEPGRISIGLVWQSVPEFDDTIRPTWDPEADVRIIDIDARQSKGVCWARNLCQALLRDEAYYLQIDSHMRFVTSWDSALLAMLDQCPGEKSILTTYPPGYEPPDRLGTPDLVTMRARSFNQEGALSLQGFVLRSEGELEAPMEQFVCAAGFLFGPAALVRDAPYDPHLYFHGEEITLSARLWTRGWNFFTPSKAVIYHWYNTKPGSGQRRLHHEDAANWRKLDLLSLKRMRHLLGMDVTTDDEALVDIELFGLGTQRSLAAYEAALGVNFAQWRVGDGPSQRPDMSASRRACFEAIYRHATWGQDETRSGSGARRREVVNLVEALPIFFAEAGIGSLVDIGCGETNWIGGLSAHLNLYIGVDIAPSAIQEARLRRPDRPNHFVLDGDGFVDPLPRVDAILCKDVLTHYPLADVLAALRHFLAADPRYLLLSTTQGAANADTSLGFWRPLDMRAPPFSLPPPLLSIPCKVGAGKDVAIWHASDLAEWRG